MHSPASAYLGQLLAACAEGDRDAFDELVRAVTPWATAHAWSVLRDPLRAQDCVQQTLLEVWQTAHRFDPARGGAKSWLLALVRHRAVDIVRASEGDRRRLEHFHLLERGGSEDVDTTIQLVCARMDEEHVRTALEVLSDAERDLVRLSYWDGLSHTQIATALGVPLGTVKSGLRRSIRKLRNSGITELVTG